ncbi:MAG: GNAT family N-acetyltransferase [Alphaproteobacteria bacterium]|nr:GNAT family N-acetyltransferase [Alphaproteobacteria bacterium]MCW5742818.1 GNAT family N-acetyltransferase [Alphaproteobacteria bacterium]
MIIRAARRQELPAIRQIENVADEIFRRVAMPWVLPMTPADPALLEDARRGGRLWVAADAVNRPVGFALLRTLDGMAWLHQLSVLPRHGGRGIGAALLEQVCARARQERHASLFLSTYLGVPWNAPFYARRGFTIVPLAQYTAAMRRERAHERQLGHPIWRRCLMRRELSP